jgi:hypothetical protein
MEAEAAAGGSSGSVGLDSKLQIKAGATVAILHEPYEIDVAAMRSSADSADAVLVFATNLAELRARVNTLTAAAQRGALAWLAYPKGRQLGTDLNRDVIHTLMPELGLDTVRQIALDRTWSALRMKFIDSPAQ